MRQYIGVVAFFTAVALTPGLAQARGYGSRGGMISTPYGSVNSNSPEWKASGGNMFVYEQIMEEKMMIMQQQMMMKQQQQMMKLQQQQAKKGNSSPSQNNSASSNVLQTLPTRRKKKIRTYDPTKPVMGTSSKTSKTATDSNKKTSGDKSETSTSKSDATP